MPEIICKFYVDSKCLIGTETSPAPPEYWERRGTGHYDGLYRIRGVDWNSHAERWEVRYELNV